MCFSLALVYSKNKQLFCVWTELLDCRIKCNVGERKHRLIPEVPHKKHKLQLIKPQITITTNHSQSVVTTCLRPRKSSKTSCGANRKPIDREPKKRKGMWADCVKTVNVNVKCKNKPKRTEHQGGSGPHPEHRTFPVDALGMPMSRCDPAPRSAPGK